MSAPSQVGNTLEPAAEQAMRRAADYLTCLQERDGHWCAELTADTTLESDYILFQLWLYPPVKTASGTPETRPLIDKAVGLDSGAPAARWRLQYLRGRPVGSQRLGEGLLRAETGRACRSDDARMQLLRERILELGGIQAANSYVKVNLSLFDLYPREYCPSIPPEVALLPFDLLYQMSAWTRAIVISLSIVHAANPRRPVPAGFTPG